MPQETSALTFCEATMEDAAVIVLIVRPAKPVLLSCPQVLPRNSEMIIELLCSESEITPAARSDDT